MHPSCFKYSLGLQGLCCALMGCGEGPWLLLLLAQVYVLTLGGNIPHFSQMPEQLPAIPGAGCYNVNTMTTQ